MLKRYDARGAWDDAGLSYAALTPANLRRLIRCIDADMKKSGLVRGTLRMRRLLNIRRFDGFLTQAQLRCKGFYFDDQEAISFGGDGFIGFAGWADDENVQPVLTGFIRWVGLMSPKR